MNKGLRLIMMNGVWIDIDQMLKLLTKTIDGAYNANALTGKEYLIMKDFREDMISRFGDKEVDYEDCD